MFSFKKIIAFDLDGTLSVSKSQMTKDMALLVARLMEQKIVVVISGGMFEQFKNQFLIEFEKINLPSHLLKNIILLPTSGSQRYEYDEAKKEWQLTDQEPFPVEIKKRATELLQDVIISELYDIPGNSKGEYIEDRMTQLSFSALGQNAPIEEKRLWDPNQEKRQKIKAFLEPQLPEVSILIGGTTTIDILPKGFTKAVGLMRLLDKLGLQKSDMIFVGDAIFPGGNDYSAYEIGIDTIKVTGPEDTENIIKEWVGLE